MSAPTDITQGTRQPATATAAPQLPLALLTPQHTTAALSLPHPAPPAQAAMAGLASKDQVVIHLDNAARAVSTAAGHAMPDGQVVAKRVALVGVALKGAFATGTTMLNHTQAVLAPTGPLPFAFDAATGTFTNKPAAEGELPQAFLGIAKEDLEVLHEALTADKNMLLAAIGAANAAPPSATNTQQATHTAPHFAPHVASPLQPALPGAHEYPAYTAAQAGTTLLPPGLDATAARALGGDHNADLLALYLASAGGAGAAAGAGAGGVPAAVRAEAGLAALGGGELPVAATYKAPALNTYLLDKKDTTTQLVLENGRVAAKKEASDTHMTQTQFMNAYMTLIQTSYAHCPGPAMRFFMHLNNLWDKYPHAALMRYERAVRQKCTKYPEIQLDDLPAHMHEFLEHVVSAVAGYSHTAAHRHPPKQEEPANKRGRAASPARGGGASGSGARGSPPAPKGKKPPCIQYNSKEGCNRGAKCGFPHTCTRCHLFLPAGAKNADGSLVTGCTACARKE